MIFLFLSIPDGWGKHQQYLIISETSSPKPRYINYINSDKHKFVINRPCRLDWFVMGLLKAMPDTEKLTATNMVLRLFADDVAISHSLLFRHLT